MNAGTKVRFLGCAHAYDGQTARLIIRDRYPATAKDVPTAIVSVQNLLEIMNHELVEVGAWLNIMGYVRALPELVDTPADAGVKRSRRKALHHTTFVEATMIWSAGVIMVDKYNDVLTDLQRASYQAG
ncbi:hypothetical protein LTR36_007937 [Oleoguttula mirabilis]|uniref:Uncharacterized protein n=1 Tax=Oleoguttula mirabilis TaxID=1507867 RepID=A0AAV9J8R8_9PEZI|nr:hypothetical protein LTR36_007937 [Oleoguttula mirabilis]